MSLLDMPNVVTRIAPSPTGYLHFGLARTALFSYLYARKHGGRFIIRIEDTDVARNKPEYEEDILRQLQWLGLKADETFRQSEHLPRHKECLERLIAEDKAYVSKEPAKDDPSRTVEVVRLRNPGKVVTFNDIIRGEITFDTGELKDFVIARSFAEPLFHVAVVIDDHDEGVTHVIRGEDHISNTARQILIGKALGFETPVYAHLPLILMPNKTKMSKRKHETSVKHFREDGILPEALMNYIATLGWTPPSDREILSLEEMVAEFELSDVHTSGAVFDIEKLNWYNRHYLHAMPSADFAAGSNKILKASLDTRGIPWDEAVAMRLAPLIRDRISVWEELRVLADEGEFDYFFTEPDPDASHIPQKGVSTADTARHLERVKQLLSDVPENDYADTERIKAALWDYAGQEGRGAVLWPLRYALTGRERSPDPFEVAQLIGKEATLRRIDAALAKLAKV